MKSTNKKKVEEGTERATVYLADTRVEFSTRANKAKSKLTSNESGTLAGNIAELFNSKEFPLNLCACMGPIGDDLYCTCKMAREGLVPTNIWSDEKKAELCAALSKYKT
jgi:hypothetical protein